MTPVQAPLTFALTLDLIAFRPGQQRGDLIERSSSLVAVTMIGSNSTG